MISALLRNYTLSKFGYSSKLFLVLLSGRNQLMGLCLTPVTNPSQVTTHLHACYVIVVVNQWAIGEQHRMGMYRWSVKHSFSLIVFTSFACQYTLLALWVCMTTQMRSLDIPPTIWVALLISLPWWVLHLLFIGIYSIGNGIHNTIWITSNMICFGL